MKNKKKKPTNKEFVHVINGILKDIESLHHVLKAQSWLLNQYIEMNGHQDKWKKFLDNKKEEYERDRLNKATDKANSNEDTKG